MEIRNYRELLANAPSEAERRGRELVLRAASAALRAVDPWALVKNHISLKDEMLRVVGLELDLARFKRFYVVGGGKAGGGMAQALEEILGDRITGGVVNLLRGTKGRYNLKRIELQEAGHPIPNAGGAEGVRRMLRLLDGAGPGDLVLCLISGGGSAIMPQPHPPITLEEKGEVTSLLLRAGANIGELNTVRKHLSAFKGGRLAQAAHPATLVTLILSDVVGDPLDVIASGPTVPDPTTFQDAVGVLEKFNLWGKTPEAVRGFLERGVRGEVAETPKAGDPAFEKVHNFVVGSNRVACLAARDELRGLGLNALHLTSHAEGEARHFGGMAASILREEATHNSPLQRPAAFVVGGETTVTVRGGGVGGRNQEAALSAAIKVTGLGGVVGVFLGTDGVDGPTDAAGAVIDGSTVSRAERLGLKPSKFLAENDSHTFFLKLGDGVITGPTGTNVNDIAILIAL